MKKVLKIGFVMSLLLASTSVFAQNTGKPEYPRYGFWSNWSIGGSLDFSHELGQGFPLGGHGWRVNTNFGMDVFAQQKLNHVFDWRLRLGMPTFARPLQNVTSGVAGHDYKETRHFTLTLDVLFSVNDALKGYDPDRKWSFYFFGGAGAAFSGLHREERQNVEQTDLGRVMVDFGQGIRYTFGEAHTLFCEYSFDIADVVNIFSKNVDFYIWHDITSVVRLGYAYGFGVTKADQAIAAQKAMLTQENFGALNSQVNNLENQVAASRSNEKKLENRIAELEDQLADARAHQGKGNSAAADSLQAVINNIKADQLNFYAMPFSVQYDVNEYKVSDDEMAKVKAVARVLKDNPDVKITVVGFADYTGSDAYNMKLSERRANEVKRLLVKNYGIDEDRIQTEYKGKSVAFGDIQYALNRRVSFYRVIE